MNNDSVGKTITVAAILCIVCSILVSGAAVSLRPKQQLNKQLDIKKNLLLAAGLLKNAKASKNEIEEAFSVVETKVIDLETGEEATDIDAKTFDAVKAAKDPKKNVRIEASKDIAGIKMRAKHSKVYLVKEGGSISQVILPVHGKGLWSTMYGFLALSPDTKMVKGFGFYQHGETPGLGGEVDNPNWKKQWIGKRILGDDFKPVIDIVKGAANPSSKTFNQEIDGLSGATITSNGVEYALHYWLGQDGFGPFLAKFRAAGGM
ncbi:MAG: Na(+)-translocating NADH-quinone reductase subunit C [Oligoflexia bacterium]|nr:Na(+)-translocating NADH-quinone reductase subunit C [Oligoflexia bacterium]